MAECKPQYEKREGDSLEDSTKATIQEHLSKANINQQRNRNFINHSLLNRGPDIESKQLFFSKSQKVLSWNPILRILAVPENPATGELGTESFVPFSARLFGGASSPTPYEPWRGEGRGGLPPILRLDGSRTGEAMAHWPAARGPPAWSAMEAEGPNRGELKLPSTTPTRGSTSSPSVWSTRQLTSQQSAGPVDWSTN
ncbi:hypothetical protein Sjap_005273 [Stephania japonica]|uniref:Uncharacterized protein n=1 Tax=Stephania japonica TaxID=461633 RepID=A0AAP0K4T9_9MAGN